MSKELEQYFATWDPMDFIKDLEAPDDEYSLEAETVLERYKSGMSSEEVGLLVYQVFIELIELDYDNFKDESIKRGKDIKAILDHGK